MNNQPVEKQIKSNINNIDIVDIFHTIQGEGPYTGHPAIFIRLAGCNLQCPSCDTDYTSNRRIITRAQLINAIEYQLEKHKGTNLLVFTGGEPFRQHIVPVLNFFIKQNHRVQVETNGTVWPVTRINDKVFIVCSPKTAKINDRLSRRVNAFKYVLDSNSINETDGLPLQALNNPCRTIVARPPISYEGLIYVQAMDTGTRMTNERNQKIVLSICLKYGYIIQLQLHKILGVD